MKRWFKLNTHLTLPLELHPAPGAKHHKAEPGHVIGLDAERCKSHDRFLRGRTRAGDMVELDGPPTVPPHAQAVDVQAGTSTAPTAPVKE